MAVKKKPFDVGKALEFAKVRTNTRVPTPAKHNMEVPAVIRYRLNKEEDMKKRVRRDYEQIIRLYFGKQLQPFHKLVWEGVLGFGDDRYKTSLPDAPFGKWVVMLPTEHAKSSTLNVLYPLLSLMENPNETHLLACSNEREAKRWLREVKGILESTAAPYCYIARDFPWLKKTAKGLWNTLEIAIAGRDPSKTSPSYSVYGWESDNLRQIRGKLVGDDLEGWLGSLNSLERERLYEKIQYEFIRCLQDPAMGEVNPTIILAGTPFDTNSTYFKLARTHGWKVFRQPYRYSNGELIWPQKREKIAELRRSLSKIQFSIAMHLDPTAGGTAGVSAETIEELTGAESSQLEGKARFSFVSLDPAAGSSNLRNDYAGIAIVDVWWPEGEDWPRIEVSSPMAFRGGPEAQVNQVAALAYSRNPSLPVVFETNGWQGETYGKLFEHLFGNRLTVLRHHTHAIGEEASTTKDGSGPLILKEFVHKGRLKIIEDEEHREGIDALRTEIQNLGDRKAHDHLCMAIWFAFRQVYAIRRRRVGVSPASSFRHNPFMQGRLGRTVAWPTLEENEAS